MATTIKSAFRAVIFVFVASIGTHAASAQSATSPIDPKLIGSTVESLAHVIQEEYFDVAVAAKVDAALKTALAEGRFASATTPETLARLLTRDLYAVTHDKHLAAAVTRPPSAVGSSHWRENCRCCQSRPALSRE